MAKTAYFDCFSGASGDMVLGALLDVGLPLDGLRAALGSLAIEYGTIDARRVLRAGVSATKFDPSAAGEAGSETDPVVQHTHSPAGTGTHVHAHTHTHEDASGRDLTHTRLHAHEPADPAGQDHAPGHAHEAAPVHGHDHPHAHGHAHHHEHHSLKSIADAVRRSALSAEGKDRAIHLFERLAEAESAIHQVPVERIHLHEVGALDSIIDIVGAVHGMEWLGAADIVVSALNVGSGTVHCAHGAFPVPAPATARLLQGAPIYAGEVAAELVTPTGALLLTSYARRYGPLPLMKVERIGYGAGSRDVANHPNVLRLMIGETADTTAIERIVTLECEVDDMNPQLFGPLMDRLIAAGALDVFYTPVQMKKNRPGTLVTVLAAPADREALTGVLFRESTTIGVRYQELSRERLDREVRTVQTSFGPIRFKVASRDGVVLNAAPEFDDCVDAAAAHGLSVKDVQARLARESV